MTRGDFRRRRLLGWGAGIAALVAIGVGIAFSLPAGGPRIRGGSLLSWLQRLEAAGEMGHSSEAAEVIRSLDAEQMGALAEMLERDWSASPELSHRINRVLDPILQFVGIRGQWFAETDRNTYCDLALGGIRILGTNAAPMVPRLVQDLKVWNTSYPAASALSMIGGDALLPVVAMLTNTAPTGLPYRWPFACGLQAASPADAGIVVPALVQALQDPEPEVQVFATQGLKTFRGHEREFVPAILRNLGSPVSRVRLISIEILGELGWKEAIPHLQRLQSDPDPHFRDAVKVALQRLER